MVTLCASTYVKRKTKGQLRDVKPKMPKPSVTTVNFVAPLGVKQENVIFHGDHSMAAVKRTYSALVGIPVSEIKLEINGSAVKDSDKVDLLQANDGQLTVTWDPVLNATNPPVKLRTVNQEKKTQIIEVNRKSSMDWVMKKYASRENKPLTSLRFNFDGARVNWNDTPESLDMSDDDVIDVNEEQYGGCFILM